jgi:23S rRNA C2498 (ribose-2'-O)-methylase RlmM
MEKGFKGIRNVNGRPKGALNKTTSETKELIKAIVSNQLGDVEALLNSLEPRDRMSAIIKLLMLVIPKEIALEVDEKEELLFKPITITLLNGN